MTRQSAGILLFRMRDVTEVFLVHPGGPLFTRKDLGAWSVPKGEYADSEDPLTAAKREFREETGQDVTGSFIPLMPVKQKSGKVVRAWAVQADLNPEVLVSNTFEMTWPPGSQRVQSFPEIDRGEWFSLETARAKINVGQIPLLDQLHKIVNELNKNSSAK